MGKKIAVEHNNRKKKKKGRPSLLDLQKRNLRLQKQQEDGEIQRNPNPNPNPNFKHRINNSSATPATSSRRGTTRNNPDDLGGVEEEEEDEEEEDGGKRREKKLKFVLRLPSNGTRNRAELDSSGSDSEGRRNSRTKKKRKIESVVGDGSAAEMVKTERQISLSKTAQAGEMDDLEPTTPLPDKKLLVFILDRLQKKDTYGVFSEPVDPEELPDYHDIIENPMDFTTIRNKLSNGAYSNLEQFEEDVYLLTSNAMHYNSSDTIYFRQARSIQELAKKDFENLRQESDDNEPEPEPKIVKRGRPPNKNIFKKPVGRPSADHSNSNAFSTSTLVDSSDKAFLSNSLNDVSRKGSVTDKFSPIGSSVWASQLTRNNERFGWMGDKKAERNQEPPGSMLKGSSTRYGKKAAVLEENHRNSYIHPLLTSANEPSVLTTFDEERKELVPVGLHMEHSYARSLARFAANLGPVGWEIAARQIEKVLPPGTKFDRGWVCEKDAPQTNRPPLPSMSSSQSPTTSRTDHPPERPDSSSDVLTSGANQPSRPSLPTLVAPVIPNRTFNPADMVESSNALKYGSHSGPLTGTSIRSNAPFLLHQNSPRQPTVNGFSSGFSYGLSQVGQTARSPRSMGSLSPEVQITHVRALDMVSRGGNSFIHPAMTNHHSDALRTDAVNQGMVSAKNNFCQTTSSHSDMDSKKLDISNSVNFANSLLYPSSLNRMDAEKTKINNSNTVNSVNTRLIQSTSRQPETERAMLSNPSTSDSGNRPMHHPEPTRQSEAQRDISGASFTLSGTATGQSEPETLNKLVNPGTMISRSPKSDSTQNPQGFWRGLSLHPKTDSAPPDLNVRFQSPGSPSSGLVTDSQHPDLALQL